VLQHLQQHASALADVHAVEKGLGDVQAKSLNHRLAPFAPCNYWTVHSTLYAQFQAPDAPAAPLLLLTASAQASTHTMLSCTA
jgi:hypothetical protein